MYKKQLSIIQKRKKWLVFFWVFIFSLLNIRLLDVQIFHHFFLKGLAWENQSFSQDKSLIRGTFLDRYGQTIAYNHPRYFALVNPNKLFSHQFEINQQQALPILATDSASLVSFNTRWYPYGQSLVGVLGFVSQPNKEDLLSDKSLSLSELKGKTGLELALDTRLRGKAGKREFVINAFGEKKKIIEDVPTQAGEIIKTTLDPFLSEFGLRLMAGKKGALVILDGQTGEVLSLISSPSFDPNLLTRPALNQEQKTEYESSWKELLQRSDQPFFNRAIAGVYPPGSVFKIASALAALESGKVDDKTLVNDQGSLKVGEYSYANWYFTQYGRSEGLIDLKKALSRSNDIFFYKAAEFTGPDFLAQMARKLGFGATTQLELFGQSAGLVPDATWKREKQGESWYLGNTYHFGIGQGDLLVTPIQVAQMTQILANQGVFCPPHLLRDKAFNCQSLGLNEENLELVTAGMLDACSAGGTAFPFFEFNQERRQQTDLSAYEQLKKGAVACKTGTAEWGGTDSRGYRQTHGWFTMAVGLPDNLFFSANLTSSASANLVQDKNLAELNDQQLRQAWQKFVVTQKNFPRILVITVLVESDEKQPFAEGSRDAAPIAKKIVDWVTSGF